MSLASVRQNGRTPCYKSKLTPKVMTALSLAATGMSWSDAAAEVNMTSEALRKWRKHPDTQPFLERVVSENLVCAKHTAISHSKRAVEVLVEIMEDKTARPYARSNSACALLDKAMKFDELDFMRKELAQVRQLLEDQESGRTARIIDVSE